jgi:hypothetical protein
MMSMAVGQQQAGLGDVAKCTEDIVTATDKVRSLAGRLREALYGPEPAEPSIAETTCLGLIGVTMGGLTCAKDNAERAARDLGIVLAGIEGVVAGDIPDPRYIRRG